MHNKTFLAGLGFDSVEKELPEVELFGRIGDFGEPAMKQDIANGKKRTKIKKKKDEPVPTEVVDGGARRLSEVFVWGTTTARGPAAGRALR